jgi:hypothetical protein
MAHDQLVLTHSRTWQVLAAATESDGYHSMAAWPLAITVTTRPLGPGDQALTDEQWDRMDEWLAQYVQGRDLTGTLSFAPTTANLAAYLLRAFTAMHAAVHKVTVADLDSGSTTTSTYELRD